MRLYLLILLIFLFSCSSSPTTKNNQRSYASETKLVSPVLDLKKSQIQIFPAQVRDKGLIYYFYLQLKDKDGNFTDVNIQDFALKTSSGQNIEFESERVLKGRYYLSIIKSPGLNAGELEFYIRDIPLKKNIKFDFLVPDRAKSKIVIIPSLRYEIVFHLILRDASNRPVVLPHSPEILVEGNANINEIRQVSEGVWEFSLSYPEDNQIFYFSVRAMGVVFPHFYRYQHIEN
jgi:hypothetical protein